MWASGTFNYKSELNCSIDKKIGIAKNGYYYFPMIIITSQTKKMQKSIEMWSVSYKVQLALDAPETLSSYFILKYHIIKTSYKTNQKYN